MKTVKLSVIKKLVKGIHEGRAELMNRVPGFRQKLEDLNAQWIELTQQQVEISKRRHELQHMIAMYARNDEKTLFLVYDIEKASGLTTLPYPAWIENQKQYK